MKTTILKTQINIKNPKTSLILETKITKDVFVLFIALNLFGYNDENNTKMHPVRKKIRDILQQYNWNQKYSRLKEFFTKNHPWYLLYTLLNKNSIASDIKKLAKEPIIQNLWLDFKDDYAKETLKLFPLFKKEVTQLIKFINKSPKKIEKIILLINLLDAYWRGYEINAKKTSYIVVGPGADKNCGELIRHELLHVLMPSYYIPSRFTSPKNHLAAANLDYRDRNSIRREYTTQSLNLLYKMEILKKDIAQDIMREKKLFPHLPEVIEIIKKQIKK